GPSRRQGGRAPGVEEDARAARVPGACRVAAAASPAPVRPTLGRAERPARRSAAGEQGAFGPGGARVDRTAVGDDLGAEASPSVDPSVRGPVDRGEVSVEVSVEVLRRAAAVFRGELLEGLDLPECYRFHEWCVAEREAARGVRASILTTLVQRLAAVPEDALGYARARVAVDPLSEAGEGGPAIPSPRRGTWRSSSSSSGWAARAKP